MLEIYFETLNFLIAINKIVHLQKTNGNLQKLNIKYI
jgi:hypothetical protein